MLESKELIKFKEDLLQIVQDDTLDQDAREEAVASILEEQGVQHDVQEYFSRVYAAVTNVQMLCGRYGYDYSGQEVMSELLTDALVLYLPTQVLYPKRFIDKIMANATAALPGDDTIH